MFIMIKVNINLRLEGVKMHRQRNVGFVSQYCKAVNKPRSVI